MTRELMTPEEALVIARLVLRLGEVERIPVHPDGQRRETDTTHSVMLALVSAVAAWRAGLDPGRAALFALVHDLAEVYAGDVDTSYGLAEDAREAKRLREAAALYRIVRELGDMGCLIALLEQYEARDEPEARLVALLDKAMPKAVRLVERQVRGIGPPSDRHDEAAASQAERLRREFPELALVPAHELADELRRRLFAAEGNQS